MNGITLKSSFSKGSFVKNDNVMRNEISSPDISLASKDFKANREQILSLKHWLETMSINFLSNAKFITSIHINVKDLFYMISLLSNIFIHFNQINYGNL